MALGEEPLPEPVIVCPPPLVVDNHGIGSGQIPDITGLIELDPLWAPEVETLVQDPPAGELVKGSVYKITVAALGDEEAVIANCTSVVKVFEPEPVDLSALAEGLHDEIVSLEAQGLLPILDRSESIGGVDADANGVRDDIDKVLSVMPIQGRKRAVLVQVAQGLQSVQLAKVDDLKAVNAALEQVVDATACLARRVPDQDERTHLLGMLEGMTANTFGRTVRYLSFNNGLAGRVVPMPDGDTCTVADEEPEPELIATTAQGICTGEPLGYMVGYFNGVFNSLAQASLSREGLRDALGYGHSRYKGEPIRYDLFYNTSGRHITDLIEALEQLDGEVGPELGNRWSWFWAVLAGQHARSPSTLLGWPRSILDVLIDFTFSGTDLVRALADRISLLVVSRIGSPIANSTATFDTLLHRTYIETLARGGVKMLLVGHSQGNFFVNRAYEAATAVAGYTKASIGVVHVAPPTAILKGEYVTADLDWVINSLRLAAFNTIPWFNVGTPFSHMFTKDFSGHGFLETYLKEGLKPRLKIKKLARGVLLNLINPATRSNIDNKNLFTATLTWDGTGDMDLHAFEPDNSHVFFTHPRGTSGRLDVPNGSVAGFGPEHYRVPCDQPPVQEGEYAIRINHFKGLPEDASVFLEILNNRMDVIYQEETTAGVPEGWVGTNTPRAVVSLKVAKNAQGGYEVSLVRQ